MASAVAVAAEVEAEGAMWSRAEAAGARRGEVVVVELDTVG